MPATRSITSAETAVPPCECRSLHRWLAVERSMQHVAHTSLPCAHSYRLPCLPSTQEIPVHTKLMHTTGRRKVSAQRSRTAKATGSCAGGFSAGVVPTPSRSADAGGANGATRSELRLQSGPSQSPLRVVPGRMVPGASAPCTSARTAGSATSPCRPPREQQCESVRDAKFERVHSGTPTEYFTPRSAGRGAPLSFISASSDFWAGARSQW